MTNSSNQQLRKLRETEQILTRIRTAASPMVTVTELTQQRCPACSDRDLAVCRYPAFKSAFFSGLILAQCRQCGLAWVPVPNFDLDNYYTHHYANEFQVARTYEGKYFDSENPAWARPVHKGRDRACRHAADLERFGPFHRVLDMGAGEGLFLNAISAGEKYACELDTYSVRILEHELGVTIQQIDDREAFFDLIMASHVLEHFTHDNIGDKLACVYNSLKPGGIFYIEVPTGAHQLQLFVAGQRPPKQRLEPHTLFFSSYALNRLLLAAGFELVETAMCTWSAGVLDNNTRDIFLGMTPMRPEDANLDNAMVMIARRPTKK